MKLREQTRDLLFEIGTEELPSAPLNHAVEQLETTVPRLLDEALLTYSDIQVYATPRRIAVFVSDLPLVTPSTTSELKGPAVSVAYESGEPAGVPTKALEGFMRSKGVESSQIEIRPVDGVEYVFAEQTIKGSETAEVLKGLLVSLIGAIEWPKTQRWGSGQTRFIRPVRWLLALFGTDVIPVVFGEVQADRYTRGHRFLAPQEISLTTPKEYLHVLKANHVIVDQSIRRTTIQTDASHVSAQRGKVLLDEDVLSENVNLTEFPQAALGSFDEEFLQAPREILEYAMATHQRYFAVERADGALDNSFVVITNSDPRFETQVVAGHERVVRARLSDAVFFYHEDMKTRPDAWAKRLAGIIFQDRLGTMAEKSARIEALVEVLSGAQGLDAESRALAQRAAHLAKADLATSAVVEFPYLQGVMGGHYATAHDEDAQVALAIREHYQPRFSGDALPTSVLGRLLSVADKLDTIAGIFALGKTPRKASDPFGLRRGAIGILAIMIAEEWGGLEGLVALALDQYVGRIDFDYEATHRAIIQFFSARLETILKEHALSGEVVNAVLATSATDPGDALQRGLALETFKFEEDMIDLSVMLKRAKNIAEPSVGVAYDTGLFGEAERLLDEALKGVEDAETALIEQRAYHDLLTLFASLKKPLDRFFDEVLVMDPDEMIRTNRLALINRLIATVERFADLTCLAVRK